MTGRLTLRPMPASFMEAARQEAVPSVCTGICAAAERTSSVRGAT